jgi:hypothetical protein
MADPKREDGLSLLNVAVTPALAAYLNDHYSMLRFEAYLWKMIVTVDYGEGGTAPGVMPGDPIPPESAAGQMKFKHSQYLAEMKFCRAVNSLQTYLAELLTMIFEARPETLKSKKKMVSREFCVEHFAANDLISALAEQTVNEARLPKPKRFG